MRTLLVAALLLCCHAMPAQTGDWSRVEQQAEGTHLIVASYTPLPCILTGVSDDGLECAIHGRLFWFDRASVDEVRLDGHFKFVLVATTIGAAAGAIALGIPHSGDDLDPGASAVAGAFIGGFFGYVFGHIFDFGFGHGHLLYRRP